MSIVEQRLRALPWVDELRYSDTHKKCRIPYCKDRAKWHLSALRKKDEFKSKARSGNYCTAHLTREINLSVLETNRVKNLLIDLELWYPGRP